MLHKHTQKFTQILFRRELEQACMFPPAHTVHHLHCWSLLGSLKERTKHPHPNGYHAFLPTTTKANCICVFGRCVMLHLHPSLPSLVKGSFYSQKEGRKKYIKMHTVELQCMSSTAKSSTGIFSAQRKGNRRSRAICQTLTIQ